MSTSENYNINPASAVVIGKFDGVHKGHQQLLSIAKDICKKENLTPLAYTFPSFGECITDDTQKAHLFKNYGIDNIYVQQLNDEFKNTSPKDFVRILTEDLNAKHVIVGFNFRFGKDRCADAYLMEKLCAETGIKCTIAQPVIFENEPISSTRIREEIKKGNITDANVMLGRNFEIYGKVIHGKKLGRTIDFPTANIDAKYIPLLPDAGVYATTVKQNGNIYPAITNIGSNPTVDHDDKIKVETNIIGFDGNLYDTEIYISFSEKLRNECTFNNIDELKKQLSQDKENSIEIFKRATL